MLIDQLPAAQPVPDCAVSASARHELSLGAAIQFVIAGRTAHFEDVSGEPIAVECAD
jgi:6,7-dimethyl-8-ribityllumazine synthase